MTARNMQDVVKKKGLPWSAVKGFDTFCPVSEFIAKSKVPDYNNVNLWLKVGIAREICRRKDLLTPFDVYLCADQWPITTRWQHKGHDLYDSSAH